MANTKTLTGTAGLDTTEFRNFAKALRKGAPSIAVELRTGLRAAGTIVADNAKARASFSSRIPGSIKTRVSSATVSVVAGGSAAPDAEAFEHGGQGGKFRHPVFGNRSVWVEQDAHPFLQPAVIDSMPAFQQEAVNALDRVVTKVIADTI